jgi:CubicO group peptidase (beta-lactamase class C family)
VSSRDDYARLLRMLLDSGTFAGRRILSPAAVAAMEQDWRRGTAVEPPAPVRSFGYGIGMWIDRADSTGRALELSSQGAFGFTPWIDRERNLLGVLAVRYDGGPEGFETSRTVRAVVREMVR